MTDEKEPPTQEEVENAIAKMLSEAKTEEEIQERITELFGMSDEAIVQTIHNVKVIRENPGAHINCTQCGNATRIEDARPLNIPSHMPSLRYCPACLKMLKERYAMTPEQVFAREPGRSRQVRYIEIPAALWGRFKKNREPRIGDEFDLTATGDRGKITRVEVGAAMVHVFYEVTGATAFALSLRCPRCAEPMHAQQPMPLPNAEDFTVFTCKTCVVEVSIYEPTGDNDIADFMNNFYPEDLEEE